MYARHFNRRETAEVCATAGNNTGDIASIDEDGFCA